MHVFVCVQTHVYGYACVVCAGLTFNLIKPGSLKQAQSLMSIVSLVSQLVRSFPIAAF